MAMTKFKIESGVQLLARLIKKPVIEDFYSSLFSPGLKYGDTVEIFGNTSSHILCDLVCEALLFNHTNAEPLGVLVFNTVGHLNYNEIIISLKKKIRKYTSTTCQTEIDNILLRTLSNLFFVDIYDATQFYTTIHNLDSIMSNYKNISLLVFDSISALYWSEQGFKITKMDFYMKSLLQIIQKVSKEYKVIIIYTRPEYFSSCKNSSNLDNDVQIAEGVNFKVQIIDDNTIRPGQVNVKTFDSCYQKYFCIVNSELVWQ